MKEKLLRDQLPRDLNSLQRCGWSLVTFVLTFFVLSVLVRQQDPRQVRVFGNLVPLHAALQFGDQSVNRNGMRTTSDGPKTTRTIAHCVFDMSVLEQDSNAALDA